MDHFLRKRQVREGLAACDFFHLASASTDNERIFQNQKAGGPGLLSTDPGPPATNTGSSPAHAEIT
ncbi:hypothetical protein [Sulfuritortus calidifontis]|uniref:hypothetical protein n=1 Tax=Sulfuritortus calidifontis TaxID=1914471 RepID=UPI000F842CDA|nr:hypothetical protein [Sulfuritortus calidifontis]